MGRNETDFSCPSKARSTAGISLASSSEKVTVTETALSDQYLCAWAARDVFSQMETSRSDLISGPSTGKEMTTVVSGSETEGSTGYPALRIASAKGEPFMSLTVRT